LAAVKGQLLPRSNFLNFPLNQRRQAPKSKGSGKIVRHGEVKHRNSKWPVSDPDVAFESRKKIMSLTINTNTSAISAAYNLNQSNAKLQQALGELSSGSKIVNPSDDAGGLAVSMRMGATIAETNAANTNVANGTSFLQTQDGSLNVAGSILTRMSELKTMSNDPTKNSGDIANYNAEFTALQGQLTDLTSGTFNGVNLFKTGGATLSIGISADGAQTQTITQSDLAGQSSTVTGAANLAGVSLTQLSTAITSVATMRAQNGAEGSGLNFATQTLSASSTNLTAAKSRITDVDVAAESTELAKDNVLVQAGASMLSQANSSSQIALKLLGQ
jgi:flagellin